MLILAIKFRNYTLHVAEVTKKKQKCLIFIVVLKVGNNLIRLDQKKEYSTSINK